MRDRRRIVVGIVAGFLLLVTVGYLMQGQRAGLVRVTIQSGTLEHRFHVELAASDPARNRGLSHRRDLAEDGGMLFDYLEPRVGVVFWMKDTLIPLDLVFVGPDGVILRIETNAAPMSEAPIPAGGIIRWVLEVRGGTCDRLGIRAGDRMRVED